MDEHERADVVAEGCRELVRIAVGVLMERYGVTSGTAEAALMDWSRVTRIGVPELAGYVVADSARGRER